LNLKFRNTFFKVFVEVAIKMKEYKPLNSICNYSIAHSIASEGLKAAAMAMVTESVQSDNCNINAVARTVVSWTARTRSATRAEAAASLLSLHDDTKQGSANGCAVADSDSEDSLKEFYPENFGNGKCYAFFRMGGCDRGDECRFSHCDKCYLFFGRGGCSRGNECEFSHK
jgi:hypothetical protein